MKKVIYAGSFDPITKGHEWVINEAAELFDEVVVAVATNAEKKSFLSSEEKVELIKKCCESLKNVRVEIVGKKFVVNYCQKQGIKYQVRGIRTATDLEYENTVLNINRQINDEVKTIFLIPPPNLASVSSSVVRGLVGFPNWKNVVKKLVPEPVFSAFLKKEYKDQILSNWLKRLRDLDETHKLVDKFSEPQRFYHTGQHIVELLQLISNEKNTLSGVDEEILIWAAIFHDIVYDPKRSDNEELSNSLWKSYSKDKGLHTETIERVSEIILATKNHTTIPKGDYLIDLFLDMDLAILGAEESRFDEYDLQIAQEYSFYPKKDYDLGRKQILTKFYNEPNLFRTKSFAHLETRAKRNLERKLS